MKWLTPGLIDYQTWWTIGWWFYGVIFVGVLTVFMATERYIDIGCAAICFGVVGMLMSAYFATSWH